MNIEKLVDAAVDLRVATLRAKEQGIIHISQTGTNREEFMIDNERDFANMIKDRKYTVERFSYDFRYKYTTTISGLKFFYIAYEFLFENDEEKLIKNV